MCCATLWRFKGFVVSDANAVHSLITHGYARDGQDAATYKAFYAGVDMDMASGTYLKYLAAKVNAGRISIKQIDDLSGPFWKRRHAWALRTSLYGRIADPAKF